MLRYEYYCKLAVVLRTDTHIKPIERVRARSPAHKPYSTRLAMEVISPEQIFDRGTSVLALRDPNSDTTIAVGESHGPWDVCYHIVSNHPTQLS